MPFVGRRRELDRLQACLERAGRGQGGLVILSGEPGVGKTSLARELAARADQRGLAVLRAGSYEGEWQAPYRLWADLLGHPSAPADDPVLARLAGHQLDTAPPLAPDDERRRLFAAVSRWLLTLAAAQPTLVILEDLQWADADSLALFRQVARTTLTSALLLVGTHRSPGEGAALDDLLAHLARETEPERVALGGLDRGEVGEYLAAQSGSAVPGALVSAIHDETGGNPFFVREVLNHLVEERKIAQHDGRWTTEASMAELGIPPGVRQVVRQRVNHLSERTQATLAMAAAFTAGIEPEVLAAVVGLPVDAVLDGMDEAVAVGLLQPLDMRRSRYDFAHAIVRHTLYDELGAAARRHLHRRVALALEATAPTQARAAELAAQHYQAGSAEGVRHCLAAADQARQASAHHQAVRFLQMAVELAGGEELDPRMTASLAIAQAEALMLDAAAASAAAALEQFRTQGFDRDEVVEFVVTVGRLLKESGALPPAWMPLVQGGLELVGEQDGLAWARLRLLVSPMAPLAEAGVHVGRWLGHDPAVCTIVLRDGTEDDRARTVEAWDWRTPDETDAVLDEARTWQHPAAVIRAFEMANRTYLFRYGDLHRTEQLMVELRDLGLRWGSAAAQGEAFTQLALCHAFMGRHDDAQDELAQARAIIEPLGALHRQHLAVNVSHATLIGYLAGTGDWESWGQRAAQLVAQPLVSRSVPLGLILTGLGGLAFAMAGRPGRAMALVEPLTTLLERSEPRDYGATGAFWMGVAACWELQTPALVPRHEALTDRYEAAGLVAGPFTCWSLVRARLAALAGDADRAVTLFAQAVVDLEAAGQQMLARIAAAEGDASGGVGKGKRDGHLTEREAEILALIASGHTNAEIAGQIHVSVPTVNRHVANLYLKIGARNRASATAYAVSHGLA